MKSKIASIVATVVAAVVLAGSLVYYNFFDKLQVDTTIGVGSKAPAFTVSTYKVENGEFKTGGDEFVLTENLDKILVLNFWATYCGPCKTELPYFSDLQTAYADDVTVLVLDGEGDYTYETLCGWLNTEKDAEGWENFSFTFGRYEGTTLYEQYGLAGAWPATVIIDTEGVIRFKKEGPMHYADLEREVGALLAEKA